MADNQVFESNEPWGVDFQFFCHVTDDITTQSDMPDQFSCYRVGRVAGIFIQFAKLADIVKQCTSQSELLR